MLEKDLYGWELKYIERLGLCVLLRNFHEYLRGFHGRKVFQDCQSTRVTQHAIVVAVQLGTD